MHNIRPYRLSDRQSCLALFDSNVPGYFTDGERADFASFLDRPPTDGSYLVVLRDEKIVACGGYVIESEGATAGLWWGMVGRARHRTGLGSLLMEARLHAIRRLDHVDHVRLDTSQHSQGFYARSGFRVEAVIADAYGPGLDRVDMLLPL